MLHSYAGNGSNAAANWIEKQVTTAVTGAASGSLSLTEKLYT